MSIRARLINSHYTGDLENELVSKLHENGATQHTVLFQMTSSIVLYILGNSIQMIDIGQETKLLPNDV